MNRLLEYQQFAIFEIVITICLTIFFIIANKFLIMNVINKNKTIIKTLHLLSKSQIVTSIQYIAWLKLQLRFLIDLETMKFLNSKTTQTSYCEQQTKYDNQELSVQINAKANSYLESAQWIKIKISFLLYYLLFSLIISSFVFYYLLFLQAFQNGALEIFNENQFVKNRSHLYAMISIKELYIYEYIDNSNKVINEIKNNVQEFINQIQDEQNEIYETNIDQVFQMFYGNYCELILGFILIQLQKQCQIQELMSMIPVNINQVVHLQEDQINIIYYQVKLQYLLQIQMIRDMINQLQIHYLNLVKYKTMLMKLNNLHLIYGVNNTFYMQIMKCFQIFYQCILYLKKQMFNVIFYIYFLCILY
ncbi:unnamed protein product [Paramecium primaurelia]|uniref:Transmembrane protein n=1 Tax=Paramecium primaurelia TaxID=5886 RepID=A0A8S1MNL2_PARPR|nr:unnamed protein product [Paramecium primaurelia]